mmetsp:Transcript_10365/g.32923  ORF Transcript_10365/g.32923 Transcript_10365/m.32923 type:complete len:218 (-) Transcript_10365:452-1105(-)
MAAARTTSRRRARDRAVTMRVEHMIHRRGIRHTPACRPSQASAKILCSCPSPSPSAGGPTGSNHSIHHASTCSAASTYACRTCHRSRQPHSAAHDLRLGACCNHGGRLLRDSATGGHPPQLRTNAGSGRRLAVSLQRCRREHLLALRLRQLHAQHGARGAAHRPCLRRAHARRLRLLQLRLCVMRHERCTHQVRAADHVHRCCTLLRPAKGRHADPR